MTKFVSLIVEDEIHHQALIRILKNALPNYEIDAVYGKGGNQDIRNKLFKFNKAAEFEFYIALTDLDLEECPPKMLGKYFSFKMHPNLIFQIAVREAEAWLIADKINFARFLGVSASKISNDPETIIDPKKYIISLAKSSGKRTIREGLIPFGKASVGKEYHSILTAFIANSWDIEAAKSRSPSLKRLVNRLAEKN
jgi:hypothetical protein